MASLSEKLRRERELRGISIKQISEETKIGVRFLEALEEDRLDLIPGEFYRRSYLRAYARYLGLDEDRAVNAYSYTQREGSTDSEEGDVADVAERDPSKWLWLAGVVVLAAATLWFLRGADDAVQGSPDVPQSGSSAPVTQPSEPSTSRSSTSATPPATELEPASQRRVPMLTSESPAASGALRLVLSVAEPCWLEIQADGQVVTTGLKEEGFRQEFTAEQEVRLWLGNAGGVSLWVNDRKAKPLGRSGQVRKDLSITPANYREFVADNDIS